MAKATLTGRGELAPCSEAGTSRRKKPPAGSHLQAKQEAGGQEQGGHTGAGPRRSVHGGSDTVTMTV